MNIKYEYKNKVYNLSLKDINKLQGYFKLSLRKKLGIDINEYLTYKGFNIECCRICGIGHPPLNIKYEILNGFLEIINFTYMKKIYCYGENKECDGIKMNSNSFEFISKINNISIEEAKILLKENNKSPFYKENHKSEKSYKKWQSRSLGYYINKYGENLGNKKYKEHISNISISNSLEGYIRKYGNELGKKMFEDVSVKKDVMSLKFFIGKNKNSYDKAIFEYEERKKLANVSIENFINKYGYDLAMEKHNNRVSKSRETFNNNPNKEEINKSRGITIANLLKKYGSMELAVEKYNKWRERVAVPICMASKESLKIFNPLIDIIIKDFIIDCNDIYIGYVNKKEFFIRDGKSIYFYDFAIRSKKIIIEYNGVAFHPKNENSEWTHIYDKKITSEISYNKQQIKKNVAENLGFKVLEIWSDDENNLDKCLEFIKSNI